MSGAESILNSMPSSVKKVESTDDSSDENKGVNKSIWVSVGWVVG